MARNARSKYESRFQAFNPHRDTERKAPSLFAAGVKSVASQVRAIPTKVRSDIDRERESRIDRDAEGVN